MKDFAAIDFETANGKRTSVCSVGIVIVKGGRIVNNLSSDSSCTQLLYSMDNSYPRTYLR
jgi:DNA polymerase III epsilon subunit-like protein